MISLLFLSCKRLHYLRRTLASIREHCREIEPSIPLTTICFDNGSSPEHQRDLQQLGFDLLLLSRTNLGIGPAMNRLVSAVRTPFLLNLQDDWVVQNPHGRPFLRQTLAILAGDPRLAHFKLDDCHFLDFANRQVYDGPFPGPAGEPSYFVQNPRQLWGGFSFPPAVTRTEALHQLGPFREDQPFRRGWAESEFTQRYAQQYFACKSPDLLIFHHIGDEPTVGWEGTSGTADAPERAAQPLPVPRIDPVQYVPSSTSIIAPTSCTLLVQYYRDSSTERQAELDDCLRANCAHPAIGCVVVFLEEAVETPLLAHEKVRIVSLGRRLTFQDCVAFSREHLSDTLCIIANADIQFDLTLSSLRPQHLRGACFALTRHDIQADGSIVHYQRSESQDAWLFRSPLPDIPADIPLGVPGCDNRFAAELRLAGVEVLNPSRALVARHQHRSGTRRYDPRQRLIGPYAFVQPLSTTDLDACDRQAPGSNAGGRGLLWVRTDALGDTVLALSMLPHLSAAFRQPRITVVCQEFLRELYASCPLVERIIGIDRHQAHVDHAYRAGIIAEIRRSTYDLAINSAFSREPIGDILTLASGAACTFAHHGHPLNIPELLWREHNARYTSLAPAIGEWTPEVDKHRHLLRTLGIDAPPLMPLVWTSAADEAWADNFLQQQGLRPQQWIALFPGSGSEQRDYHRYGTALAALDSNLRLPVVALGARSNAAVIAANLADISWHHIDLAGATTVGQATALLKRCRLAVGAETGLAHVAAAVGVPTVVALGGMFFGRFVPYAPRTSAVCRPMDCFGCHARCVHETARCVQDLDPRLLTIAIREALTAPTAAMRISYDQQQAVIAEQLRVAAPTANWVPVDLPGASPAHPLPSDASPQRRRLVIKFPTRGRPERFFPVLERYLEFLSGDHDVAVVVSCDEDDMAMNQPEVIARLGQHNGVHLRFGPHRTKVEAINADIPVDASFDILVLASDDMIPQRRGYDRFIVEQFERHFPTLDGVLFCNDGFQAGRLNTMPILGRPYYQRFGYIYHPDYVSLWCDNEFTEVARHLHRQVYCDDILFRHEHPANVGTGDDALYRRNESFTAQDRATYERRRDQGFGLTSQPASASASAQVRSTLTNDHPGPTRGTSKRRQLHRPTVHFVYSGNPTNDTAIRAPETIANHVYRFLEQHLPVRYYDLRDRHTSTQIDPSDIILGHPDPGPQTMLRRLFQNRCAGRFLLWPFHTALPAINRFVHEFAPNADRLFMISGPSWLDTIDQTEYAPWKAKVVRVDNAIDLERFTIRKRSFNHAQERGIFVYGRSGPEKGSRRLFELLAQIDAPAIVAGNFAREDLAIIEKRPRTRFLGWINLEDEEVVGQILASCDYYLQTPVSDASPTTLLESMALGLIPLTTGGGGYAYSSFVMLPEDPQAMVAGVERAIRLSEVDLTERQTQNWQLLRDHHTWDNFCSTIWQTIAGSIHELNSPDRPATVLSH